METHGPKKRIYYDGGCRVCSAAAVTYAADESYVHFDVSKGELPEGISQQEAMRDMHVVDESGRMYRGEDAVMRVMDEHRYFKYLTRIGRLPGVHAIAHMLYRIVAEHRHLLGRTPSV